MKRTIGNTTVGDKASKNVFGSEMIESDKILKSLFQLAMKLE
jgi:hypothetical protein